MKGGMGQGKARSQVRKGRRGVRGGEDTTAKKGRGWRREGMFTEVEGMEQAGSWWLKITESNQIGSRTHLIKNGVLPHLHQGQPGQRKAIFPLLSVISLS